MRLIKRTIHMGGLWLIVAICLWSFGSSSLLNAVAPSGEARVSLRYSPETKTSFSGIQNFYDEQSIKPEKQSLPGLLTAWAEEKNQSLSALEWNAYATADVYYVDGNVRDVLNLKLISGYFPERTDKQGVAIDVNIAVKLLGSSNPVGVSIRRNEKEYVIRGVFESPKGLKSWGMDTQKGMAVFSAAVLESGSQIGVQGVEVILPAGGTASENESNAVQTAGYMGLGGASLTIDHSSSDSVLRQLTKLPGWVMMAFAFLMLLHAAYRILKLMSLMAWRRLKSRTISVKKARNTFIKGIILSLAAFLGAFVVYMTARPDFSMPTSYMPTQWSDTGFWTNLIKELIRKSTERYSLPFYRPDIINRALISWGVAFIGLSVFCLFKVNSSLKRVLGRSVSTRLTPHPDEPENRVSSWDSACYLLLVTAVLSPSLGALIIRLLGLTPATSGSLIVIQVLPTIFIAVELFLRLWPSAFWPLRISFAGLFKNFITKVFKPGKIKFTKKIKQSGYEILFMPELIPKVNHKFICGSLLQK